jgi:hypothetical protein
VVVSSRKAHPFDERLLEGYVSTSKPRFRTSVWLEEEEDTQDQLWWQVFIGHFGRGVRWSDERFRAW